MARLCPACSAQIESDSARFCGTCGGRLDTPPAAEAATVVEVATVVERVSAPQQATPAAAAAPSTEALEFTAICPSCGAANPADTEICQFCGEEIPVDERRRRTAVFGALGAGGAGLAGGIMAGRGAGEAMSGMGEVAGQGMQGLGQAGPGMQGLGQAGPAMQGLGGAAPQQAVPGMGAAQAGSAGTPGLAGSPGAAGVGAGSGAPGASPASMGAGGAPPSAPAPPASPGGGPLPGDATAIAPPVAPPPPAPPPAYVPGAAPVTEGGKSIGSIIGKTVLGGIGVIGGVVVGAVVLGGILVFTGDPSPCVERSSEASDAAVTSLFAKWEEFKVAAAAGPATVTFTEPEVTSRAVQYVNEKDIPLEDLQVYFCPDGKGQVKGKVRALGRDINVLLEGTVDTSVQPPVIVLEEIKAGNLPSAVAEQIVGDRLDKNDVKTLDFGIPISAVTITDGQVTLESPGP